MKKNLLLILILCVIILTGCSSVNKGTKLKPTFERNQEVANFTLIISNQSIEKENIKIKLYIDKQLCVDDSFLVKDQHNYTFYYYTLPKGIHNITVKSEDGATINKRFTTTNEKYWAYLTYWYSTGKNGDKIQPSFRLNLSNKPIGFD